jgi:3'-phosphoadenosine 5'-phosphosulfate sulfotransferase (PAPS reductase)/FAD synthetase
MNNHQFVLKDTLAKAESVLKDHKNIRIAYSGGSDSDIILHLLRPYNIKALFYDTGIEWDATKEHIKYMQSRGYDIETIKAHKPVPTSNKQYGHPFLNKRVSDYLQRLQGHDFDFKEHGKLSFPELIKIYPTSTTALKWWCNEWGDKSRFNISYNPHLKEFLIEHGLPFKVSAKCCDGAKKQPIKGYAKEHKLDLVILGIRKSEKGGRVGAYSSCYIQKSTLSYGIYLPMFLWHDDTKQWYKETHNIQHSKCYTDYNLKRTGCAGCPLGLRFDHELIQLEQHEPRLAKGIQTIFKPTYEWTRKYREYQIARGTTPHLYGIDNR